MYLYQGEELGLPEVADIPDEARQDPVFFRNRGTDVGRDGCRVPLPWTATGTSFGFGRDGAYLPQPGWFGSYAVDVQDVDPRSTLSFYRRAVALRRELQRDEHLEWIAFDDPVVAFRRDACWVSLTNFGSSSVPLPDGSVIIASSELPAMGFLPADTTVWMQQVS